MWYHKNVSAELVAFVVCAGLFPFTLSINVGLRLLLSII